jgi:hypothetical protein
MLGRAHAVLFFAILGCGGDQTASRPPNPSLTPTARVEFQDADISVLYFGNSHTSLHDVPGRGERMILFRRPSKTCFTRYIPCGFLDDSNHRPDMLEAIQKHPWKYVVLQAQKISSSGKYRYSQKEGIALAKAAKDRGANVYYFSEWGRRDVPRDGVVQESIYQEMADAAGVHIAPVGRAWDLALERKPSLPLHDPDGNHQSSLGAFLTGCVFYGLFTDSDPLELVDFEYPIASKEDRRIMATAASDVWKQERAKQKAASEKRR